MTKIIIPTYNRSAKLARTLKCYKNLKSENQNQIIVLDGSDPKYLEENKKVCSSYANVTYISRPGTKFLPRVIEYLETLNPLEPVCLGTDEDVFFPDYLEKASNFLKTNPAYSMLIGRYFTFLRPWGPLHRLSHYRDLVTVLDINQSEISRRMALLSNAISLGCPPVFWGVRRTQDFLVSLKSQEKLYFQTSQEILDQIILAYQGKVKIDRTPMLLRDETNLDYIYTEDRQHAFNYFPVEELEKLSSVLTELGGADLDLVSKIFIDKYLLDFVTSGSPCLAVQSHNKSYTKYEPLSSKKDLTYKVVYLLMKSAMVFTEMLTALKNIKLLEKSYGKLAIKVFLAKTRSNQIKFKA